MIQDELDTTRAPIRAPIQAPRASRPAGGPLAVVRPPGRGFGRLFLLAFVLGGVVLFFINAEGNATGLFPSTRNPAMNERAWKARQFERLARSGRAPKCLVIGSSRAMQIEPAYLTALTGKPAFNFGVSAGNPVDYLAELRYALATGAPPDLIVLGVDEWALSDAYGSHEDVQLVSSLGLWGNTPSPEKWALGWEAFKGITPENTAKSFYNLVLPADPKRRGSDPSSDLLLGDGYLVYTTRTVCREARRRLPACDPLGLLRGATRFWLWTFDEDLAHAVHNWHRALQNGEAKKLMTVSDRRVRYLREFLALAAANGVEVRVALLPLHPKYVAQVSPRHFNAARSKVNQLLAGLCREAGARYANFGDPRSYGGRDSDFWDNAHQTSANTRRMMNVLFDKPPGYVAGEVPSDFDLLRRPPGVSTRTMK